MVGGVAPYAWDLFNAPAGLFFEDQASTRASCLQDPSRQLTCDQDGYVLLKGKALNVGKFSKVDVMVTDSRGVKVSKTFELTVSETAEIKIYKGYAHYHQSVSEPRQNKFQPNVTIMQTSRIGALLQSGPTDGDLIDFTSTSLRSSEKPIVATEELFMLDEKQILKIEVIGHRSDYTVEYDYDISQLGSALEKRVEEISYYSGASFVTAQPDTHEKLSFQSSLFPDREFKKILYLRVKEAYYENELSIPVRVLDIGGNVIGQKSYRVRVSKVPTNSAQGFGERRNDVLIYLPLYSKYEEDFSVQNLVGPHTFSIRTENRFLNNSNPDCQAAAQLPYLPWSVEEIGENRYNFGGGPVPRTFHSEIFYTCGEFTHEIWIEAKGASQIVYGEPTNPTTTLHRTFRIVNVALESKFDLTIPVPSSFLETFRYISSDLLDGRDQKVYSLQFGASGGTTTACTGGVGCAYKVHMEMPDWDEQRGQRRSRVRRPPNKVKIFLSVVSSSLDFEKLKHDFLNGYEIEIKGQRWKVNLGQDWTQAEFNKAAHQIIFIWRNLRWQYIGSPSSE
ncbi:MAG: hypothetical protein A3I05_06315 [Deltaproteobacteria bacterium RIFCSPLOWO2_02_FULL_44_10]|nr:MAG: hypothetical protein A3I05_06315 [Deltaproteobacteria bacterium RIFCSPLOWO2_02_FULL_44_10]